MFFGSPLKYKSYCKDCDRIKGKSASIPPEEERGKRNQIKEFKFVSALSPKVCHAQDHDSLKSPNDIHFVDQLHYTIEVMQYRIWEVFAARDSCFQVGRHFSFCALIIDR